MSYINYKLLAEHGLDPLDYHILVAAKQNSIEDMQDVLSSVIQDDSKLKKLTEKGYLKHIKKKRKSDSELSTLRADKKGKDLLENVSIPEVDQSTIDMYNYLKDMYMLHEDAENRSLGNQKKTKQYVAILRHHLGQSLHQFYWMCWLFLANYPYTRRLENIFLDPNKERYAKFENNIDSSSLYQWYQENKELVKTFWKKKGL